MKSFFKHNRDVSIVTYLYTHAIQIIMQDGSKNFFECRTYFIQNRARDSYHDFPITGTFSEPK